LGLHPWASACWTVCAPRASVGALRDALAAKGYRAFGVARSEDDGASWSLLGILPMFDPPRDDSKETIERANAKGVRVKMTTGDDTAIACETARQLGMGANIVAAADAFPKDMDPNSVPPRISDAIERADGFARVFPEHKYVIVKTLQARGHFMLYSTRTAKWFFQPPLPGLPLNARSGRPMSSPFRCAPSGGWYRGCPGRASAGCSPTPSPGSL